MIGTDSYIIVIELRSSLESNTIDYRDSKISLLQIDDPIKFQKKNKMLKNSIEPLKASHLGEGIIRLYREFEDVQTEYENEMNELKFISEESSNESDDTMVSIIAIPSYFTATDVLGFIGETYMKFITHLRILKSEKPNRFLVLIKFNDILKAAEFQNLYNGKPFNSMEPELCHVIFIKTVKFKREDNIVTDEDKSTRNALIPFLLEDPFTTRKNNSNNSQEKLSISENRNILELPTCPVCLERMDATITGLLTIPCQHTFHCSCLSKWSDDSCPICRYSNNIANRNIRKSTRRLSHIAIRRNSSSQQYPTSLNSLSEVEIMGSENTDTCMDCSTDSNLWICLICGNVGCDRYAPEQHSLKHFISTGHCFAMELNTSRVWDYAGDNYVHRLVTNESDGKIVELPEKGKEITSGSSNQEKTNSDKVDQIGFEYSQLLISQLASQREYYEGLIENKEVGKARRKSSITITSSKISDLENMIKELKEDISELTTNTIPSLKSKLALKDEKINSLTKELNSANSLNDALSNKVDYLVSQEEKLKTEVMEIKNQNTNLTEQVSDLMFFLDNQEKFKDQPDEVRDGTIHIEPGPSRKTGNKKKKK